MIGTDPSRVYVSHDSHVDVLDLDGDTLVGRIAETPDVHGVVLAPELGRGYTSNGGDSTLSIFDPRTLSVSGRIRLRADGPDGLAYDALTRRVFALHGASPGLTVIDAGPDTVVATIPLGGVPDGGVSDGQGKLYVTLKDSSKVVVLDTRRLSIIQRWPLAPCGGPDAIAIDRQHGRLFIGCDNGVAVVQETIDGRIQSSFPIGPGVDGIALGRDGALIVSTGSGSVTVARQDGAGHYRATTSIQTSRGSATEALDAGHDRLLLPWATLSSDSRQGSYR